MEKTNIMGLPWPVFLLCTVVTLIGAYTGIFPKNTVGVVLFLFIGGTILQFIGAKIPVFGNYLGGSALLPMFGGALLVAFNLLPSGMYDQVKGVYDSGLLDIQIAALICGNILGVINSKTLKAASLKYLPMIFLSQIATVLFVVMVAFVCRFDINHSLFYVSLPCIAGGTAGAILILPQMFAGYLGVETSALVGPMVGALVISNILAIVGGGLLNGLGKKFPKLSGNGQIIHDPEMEKKMSSAPKRPDLKDVAQLGTGLIITLAFYLLGYILNHFVPALATYVWMLILCAVANLTGIIPEEIRDCTVYFLNFVIKNFAHISLFILGIVAIDLKAAASVLSIQSFIIIFATVLAMTLAPMLLARLFKFYPIEAGMTAGLCSCNIGGTGDLAVLTAGDRLSLMPFARVSTSIGGAMMQIGAGLLAGFLL
ncbi:2-hydroxycarboxylate transporter family protein [Caproiciproducens faecalis]|uniref:2-hydroxycarboxylate transporter family protein n=1 Tax=Caproiciproducens faecalis TaxID=2820301 RepID=A0ABS7DLB2_9FIRM|nr:2-hydroxycarboxylate transporter family protein [Caproiciproducens faecalis]MBW7571336.1 2-hydroxycarboxylate transporter family protein [Caproiciproducens faecalis]